MENPTTGAALDLSGRRALVTGAASGIGRAIAGRLATAGARVVLADVNGEGAEQAAAEIGGEPWVVDLADGEALVGLDLDVDVLVNNAGFQHVAPITEFPPEVFAAMHRVMVQAPFLLARACLPGMYASGFGRVVNISSHLGIRAAAYKVAYVSAKHALIGLSEVIALEGAPYGVTSNAICPSYVWTPLVENQVAGQAKAHGISEGEVADKVFLASPAIKRFATVEEVAELVAFLCTPAASFITAATYTLDGGAAAR
ncbi:MAG TPA: SDR family oxidoreductase [Acidimicrobiales bacterium]|nr:SDR family oxidoreductase [Acidimicrobiales bacterium]